MEPIVTLTLNPTIDVQWDVETMEPERKLRASKPLSFPGGGGVNVSRVIKVLGGMSIAVFTAGNATGALLRELIDQHGLLTRVVPIQQRSRVSATVFETSTGQEFRITPPGPEMTEREWQGCLDAVFEFETRYIVATGSLPPGVPADFYARVARQAHARGIRVILDTSGEPFHLALAEGVYMVKPNLRELRQLTDTADGGTDDQSLHAMTQKLIGSGRTQIVAVSLGADGAFLNSGTSTKRVTTPRVEVKSAVGAGDSFVGGMTLGLARDMPLEAAFTLGVAAGTATVLTAGSELCRRDDVERLFKDLSGSRLAL